jgi:hypothetical protein
MLKGEEADKAKTMWKDVERIFKSFWPEDMLKGEEADKAKTMWKDVERIFKINGRYL